MKSESVTKEDVEKIGDRQWHEYMTNIVCRKPWLSELGFSQHEANVKEVRGPSER